MKFSNFFFLFFFYICLNNAHAEIFYIDIDRIINQTTVGKYINSEFEMFRKQYYLLNLARQTRLLGRWVKIFNQSGEDYLKYILPTKKRIISSLDNIQHNQLKKIYESILIN